MSLSKAHENIEVTLEAYGSNYYTKISAGMGSGDDPGYYVYVELSCICRMVWNRIESYIEKEGGAEFKGKIQRYVVEL